LQLTELFHSEEGIASFCVSPDGRFVAAVTNIRSLLLMSIPYVECIAQHIHPHSHLLLKSQQECDSESDNSVSTDLDVSIAWRSDSKYFAVNNISGKKLWNDIIKINSCTKKPNICSGTWVNPYPEFPKNGGIVINCGTIILLINFQV